MKLAIMQPYLFAYIGYWQLINEVDTFVIFDDVNFIKRGYINKNYILMGGKSHRFSLELIKPSQNKLINETKIVGNFTKLLKTFEMAYKSAPYFKNIIPLIEIVLNQKERNLAKFIGYSIVLISVYLELDTKFIYSTDVDKDNSLKGQSKILNICKTLKATNYINSFGGIQLYDKNIFLEENISLSFIKTELVDYKQYENKFVPYLSIVDILMFNSKLEIRQMLKKFEVC